MALVHGGGAEPALPQVTGDFQSRVNPRGIAAVGFGEGGAPLGRGRDHDEMDVGGHQAIGLDLSLQPLRRSHDEIEIGLAVRVAEEDDLAPVPTLRHVMG